MHFQTRATKTKVGASSSVCSMGHGPAPPAGQVSGASARGLMLKRSRGRRLMTPSCVTLWFGRSIRGRIDLQVSAPTLYPHSPTFCQIALGGNLTPMRIFLASHFASSKPSSNAIIKSAAYCGTGYSPQTHARTCLKCTPQIHPKSAWRRSFLSKRARSLDPSIFTFFLQ